MCMAKCTTGRKLCTRGKFRVRIFSTAIFGVGIFRVRIFNEETYNARIIFKVTWNAESMNVNLTKIIPKLELTNSNFESCNMRKLYLICLFQSFNVSYVEVVLQGSRLIQSSPVIPSQRLLPLNPLLIIIRQPHFPRYIPRVCSNSDCIMNLHYNVVLMAELRGRLCTRHCAFACEEAFFRDESEISFITFCCFRRRK